MTGFELSAGARRAIAELTAKGRGARWEPAEAFQDDRRIALPRFMPRRLYVAIVSQFLHGERATVRLCRQLKSAVDDADVQAFLDTQIADEIRHAQAYEMYLERLGGAHPIDPHLAAALDRALGWEGPPQAWLLGFHVLLEGEALRTLLDFQAAWPCPVFAWMNTRISRDEARHVAFGKRFLADTLPALPDARHQAIYADLKTLWREAGSGLLGGARVPGFFTRRLRRRWLETGWEQHRRAFAEVGLRMDQGAAQEPDRAA